jgi:sarcosine oxidase subunit alpha
MLHGTRRVRLESGGAIDRGRKISFRFDGRAYTGFAGDTLASALLANGVRLVGRSFKYHRPRGILSAGSEEPNALVELRRGPWREPNTRATMVEIFEGLEAWSQNRFPSLKFDVMAVNNMVSPLFAAGFYYKTFMWPASFWEKVYEPLIRRAAGLGRAAGLDDPDSYEQVNAFCDVLVVGAGAAGRAAAAEAVAAGKLVVVCDERAPGGDVAGARYLPRTTVFGVYDGGTYGAVERVTDHLPSAAGPRQRLWRIVAKNCVLASGAIERPIVFANNDLPGVMLAGAVEIFATRYGVAAGQRVLVFGNHDGVGSVVAALVAAGVRVVGIVDPRTKLPSELLELAVGAGIPVFSGSSVRRAVGRLGVEGAEIVDRYGGVTVVACDVVAMSGGWNPAVHLTSHLDGKPVWDESIAAFVPGALPTGMSAVGTAAGEGINGNILPLWKVEGRGKAFVDFQNDVTATDVTLAKQEGFAAIEHLKRYTTLGMATDQGKTANVNGLALMAAATGKSIPETGTTRFRPPYTPVAIGVLAGAHRGKQFRPTRTTPTHDWAAGHGAVFVETGLWLRAQYFPKAGEDWLAAASREVAAVRAGVGVCDVTTLGKIDVQGKDAAAFLDRVYANRMSTLAVGRVRYGVMLREDGFVMDDGTCARLADSHFVVTTTTANAAKVFQHMEFCRQWLWPAFDVALISVTDQWAQLAMGGPRSREVLAKIVDAPFDISNAAFPYMEAGALTVCGGVKARLFRLSFSGEPAYEIAVPARFGAALARALMAAGAEYGIVPYGTEALGVMRIEKGHPAGAELNGQTTAHDLGIGALLSGKKDFVGRAMAGRAALTDQARPSLVGLRPVGEGVRLRAGSHLLRTDVATVAANDEGYVTSAAYSPTFGHWIALALLANGPARIGEKIRVYDPVRNGDAVAEIVAPVFYDPAGGKLRA